MKKSTRILAILMAFVMLFGSFSVVGSAYSAYKGDAMNKESNYNDVDAPVYTTNQYASMAMDELDRMLAEENMTAYVYIGTIDLRSVNNTLTSVVSLIENVPVAVLSLLGDVKSLKEPIVNNLKGVTRDSAVKNGDDPDLQIIYALLNLIGDLAPIVTKYAAQTLDVGVLNGMIGEYMFDISELLMGLLYGMTADGKEVKFDALEDLDKLPAKYSTEGKSSDEKNTAAMTLLQDLLNESILGEWTKLDDKFADVKVNGKLIKQHTTKDDISEVKYSYYNFDGKYGEKAPDVKKYDYYGWVCKNEWVTVGLGGCVRVKEGDPAPAPDYSALNLSGSDNGYDFIENLMRQAYNGLLIPLLNRDTRVWLRKQCGIVYDHAKTDRYVYDETLKKDVENPTYDASYDGETYDITELEATNRYARLFNLNARVPYADFDNKYKNATFVDSFNDILGEFVAAILKNNLTVEGTTDTVKWTWEKGDNSHLFHNICSVARAVLAATDDLFLPKYFETATATEIMAMSDQQVVSYVLRAIFNGSVSWMYIDDSCQTVVDVCYSAVEQLAWQDIPEQTYTKPEKGDMNDTEYQAAIVDKCLDILLDVAIYNLNQDIDMVPATSSNPIMGEGLLQYQGDSGSYEKTVLQVAAWAFNEYAPVLALDLKCGKTNGSTTGLTMDDFWADLDTIIDSIIPIKANGSRAPYINSEIASKSLVSKSFIFDYVVTPIVSLDATEFAKIFKRNVDGSFAKMGGVEIIVDLLRGIFDLVFPGVFTKNATSIGQVLDNELLGNMVGDLLQILGTDSFTGQANKTEIEGRGKKIAKVALPVVCMLLDLNEDQKFKELENYIPSVISLSKDDKGNTINPTFLIYNGSSGVNTAYRNKTGDFTFDKLYTYEIVNANVTAILENGTTSNAVSISGVKSGDKLSGGESKQLSLSNISVGQLIKIDISYKIKLEDGNSYLADGATLVNTSYCYVADSDKVKDDDSIEKTLDAGNDRKIKYESEIYIKSGKKLSSISGHGIRIADNNVNKDVAEEDVSTIVKVPASVTAVTNSNSNWQFAVLDSDTTTTTAEMDGRGGTYFLNPFDIAKTTNEKGETVDVNRVEPVYQKDANGKYVLNDDGEKIQIGYDDGVPVGKYTMTATVNVGGTVVEVPVNVHIYDDYNLESLVNNAIGANRQKSDYKSNATVDSLWANYQTALNNAAFLALKPKDGTTFEATVNATADHDNLYKQRATALENAIEALDTADNLVSAGIDSVKSALKAINHGNDYNRVKYTYNGNTYYYKDFIEYYESDYPFFSMRDFVPHTFNSYRIARNRANNIINSQEFYTDTPADMLDEQLEGQDLEKYLENYKKSVDSYDKSESEKGAVSSIEASYAVHMLELMGGRLIRKVADKSKLELAIAMCTGANSGVKSASAYTAKTWENYQNAVTFATKINAMDAGEAMEPSDLTPSMVNTATSKLIESWKKLMEVCDYTQLDSAIDAAVVIVDSAGTPDENEEFEIYTNKSYRTFWDAYQAALEIKDGDVLEKTSFNQRSLDKAAATLSEAIDNLKDAGEGGDPFWELLTDCEFLTRAELQDPYSPWLDIEDGLFSDLGNAEIYGYEDYAEYELSGFLFGLPEGGIESVEDIIDTENAENVSFELVANENDVYSTGALLVVRDSEDEIIAIYMLVLRGDVDGNGIIEFADLAMLDAYLFEDAGIDWYEAEYISCYASGDINYDFAIDLTDVPILDVYQTDYSYDILQTNQSGYINADGELAE